MGDDHAARSAAPLGIPDRTWRAALDASFPERATGSLGDLAATFRTLAHRTGADPSEEALTAACAAELAETWSQLPLAREDNWAGPFLPSLTGVLSLLEPSRAVVDLA